MYAREVRTKLNKDDKSPKTTKVTVDFSGVEQDKLEELAAATVIINEQAVWRESGDIPTECTIKVSEQLSRPRGGGFKVTPENLANKINSMPEDKYRESLVALGLDERTIEKMVRVKYHAK